MSAERLARMALTFEVEQFLYREAELIDERRYDEWLTLLDEALALARETDTPGTILTAIVERARLPDGDAAAAVAALEEYEARVGHRARMTARFHLWQLTGDTAHLEEAKRLLDFAVEHAPEEDREAMIENVPMHRDITEAWRDR